MTTPCSVAKARPVRALERRVHWAVRAVFAVAIVVVLGCVSTPLPISRDKAAPEWPLAPLTETSFHVRQLSTAGGLTLTALERPTRAAPARYRVLVIPGSGCAGMAPLADRYFAGLLHAEVLVLHKPWVEAQAHTQADRCSAAFVQADALGAWRTHAIAALRADAQARVEANRPTLRQLLVGISEGAELLPALAPEVPHLAGLVVIGSSGLDPKEALALQAARQGALAPLHALEQAQASYLPGTAVREGRSLRYWRELWQWPLAAPLLAAPWPLLQVWGEEDALVPQAAYQRFSTLAHQRAAPYCTHRFAGADHGLQRAGHDGVQQVWAWLEQWAREPDEGLCAGVPTPE